MHTKVKIILYLLLGTVSIIGDKLVIVYQNHHLVKGIIDNATHGCVAGLSWTLIIFLLDQPFLKSIPSILLCGLLSSFVDVDHFIEAKSLNINDATNLDRRPFFHCTTLAILIWGTLMIVSKLGNINNLNYYAWMLLTSFLSHHIRDGNRRGLWIFPFGSTRKIPYYLYIFLTMLLPYLIYLSMETPKKINKIIIDV